MDIISVQRRRGIKSEEGHESRSGSILKLCCQIILKLQVSQCNTGIASHLDCAGWCVRPKIQLGGKSRIWIRLDDDALVRQDEPLSGEVVRGESDVSS